MDPNSNQFVPLKKDPNKAGEETEALKNQSQEMSRRLKQMVQAPVPLPNSSLVRPDGSPVPDHWSVFTVGEDVVIKNYTFRVGHIGEKHILFEPVGPLLVSGNGCKDMADPK